MKEIIINVDAYNQNSIKTIEGDNLSEVYKIYICKNKRRVNLTNKIAVMAYVDEYNSKRSNILNLNITNAAEGEIELPITNIISEHNGVYACQVAIYGENNSLEQTAPFSLIVENNIFSKISNTAINSSDFHILSEAIKTTNAYGEKLKEGTENIELQYAKKLNEKMNKDDVLSMANMGQDIKEAMTGGSVAVVGRDSVGSINIQKGAITEDKINNELFNNIVNGISILSSETKGFKAELDTIESDYRYWKKTPENYIEIGISYPESSNTNIYAYLPSSTSSNKNAMWNVLENNDYMLIDYNLDNLNAQAYLEFYFYTEDLSRYFMRKVSLEKLKDSIIIDIRKIAKDSNIDINKYPYFYFYGITGAKKFMERVNISVVVKGCVSIEEFKAGLNLKEKINAINNNAKNVKNDIEGLQTNVQNIKEDIKNKQFTTVSDDALPYRKIIDDYYFAPKGKPNSFEQDEYLDSKLDSIPQEGKKFIFYTDTHWTSNSKKSTNLIQYARTRLGIKKIIFGGDILDRENDKYLADLALKKYMNEMKSAFSGDYIVVPGNHDLNTANIKEEQEENLLLPYRIAYRDTLTHISGSIHDDTTSKLTEIADGEDLEELKAYMKMHYYVDDDENKIRYVILQSGNQWNGVVRKKFGIYAIAELYLQLDWLAETLKTVKDGYTVVVLAHQLISYSNNLVSSQAGLDMLKLLSARKLAKNVTINCPLNSIPFYAQGEHTYDFNGLQPLRILAICGDNHLDVACVAHTDLEGNFITKPYEDSLMDFEDSLLVFSTQCDGYRVIEPNNPLTNTMTGGTITEQCVDIVTLTDENVICTRIGTGLDRKFLFK